MFPQHFNLLQNYARENNEVLTGPYHNELINPLDDKVERYQSSWTLLLMQNFSLFRGGVPEAPFNNMTHSQMRVLRISEGSVFTWSLDRLRTLKRATIVGALRRFEFISLLLSEENNADLCDGKRSFLKKNANQNLLTSVFLGWLFYSRGGQDIIIIILDFFRDRLREIPSETARCEYLKNIMDCLDESMSCSFRKLISNYFIYLIRPSIEELTEHTFFFFKYLCTKFLQHFGMNTNDSSPFSYVVCQVSAAYAALRIADIPASHNLRSAYKYCFSYEAIKRRFWFRLEDLKEHFSEIIFVDGDLPYPELNWTMFIRNRGYDHFRVNPLEDFERTLWNVTFGRGLNKFITRTFHGQKIKNNNNDDDNDEMFFEPHRSAKFKQHPHMDELPYCLEFTLNGHFGPICNQFEPAIGPEEWLRRSRRLTLKHKNKVQRFKDRQINKIKEKKRENKTILMDRRLAAEAEVL